MYMLNIVEGESGPFCNSFSCTTPGTAIVVAFQMAATPGHETQVMRLTITSERCETATEI